MVRCRHIPPQFYADDTLIEPFAADGSPVYFFNPGADYEGTGHMMAGVVFFEDPSAYKITWRGLRDHAGVWWPLITNPIVGFFDAFEKYGGLDAGRFRLARLAMRRCELGNLGRDVSVVLLAKADLSRMVE